MGIDLVENVRCFPMGCGGGVVRSLGNDYVGHEDEGDGGNSRHEEEFWSWREGIPEWATH